MSSSTAPATYRCIWCLQDKPPSAFTIEHVMPQGFGTFEQNLTLVNEVCGKCNNYFSRELEPYLTRDSLEGFDRFQYGLKEPSEFKSQGDRSTTRVQMMDGFYAGAWGYTVPGKEALGCQLFPQVGYAKSADGPYEWYLLDELPTLDDLKAKGYVGQVHFRLCECNDDEVLDKMRQRGSSDATLLGTSPPESGPRLIEHVFRPGLHHRRALAKIALNYLAYEHGGEVAREPRFDAIRDLVMRGVEPEYSYYAIDAHPIVHGDKQNGQRLLGHALVVQHRGIDVSAIVSLYNRFRHGIRLAVAPGTPIEPRGRFFDTMNRVIHLLVLADPADPPPL